MARGRVLQVLLAAVAAFFVTGSALAWDLKEMNTQVDETNFIVGRGCSGTLISLEYRLILTAYHCIDRHVKYEQEEVVGPDGAISTIKRLHLERVDVAQRDYRRFENIGEVRYRTEIAAYSEERDIAILQLLGDNLRSTMAAPLLPEGEEVLRGEPVTAVGNPRGLDASVTTGVVSSTSRTFNWGGAKNVPMIQYDAAGAPGSSGGALYDSKGRLIGITVGGSAGEFVIAIPVYEVHEVLAEHCFSGVFNPAANDDACREEAKGKTAKAANGG